jgi:hypothetical protein
MAIWFVPAAGGTVKIPYLTNHTCRITVSDDTFWDIFGNHTASTDYAVFSDDYPREYRAIDA